MFFLQYFISFFLLCTISESWYVANGRQRYIQSQSNGYRDIRRGNPLNDSPSSKTPSLNIEPATNADFDKIATFLAYYLYPDDVPTSQRRELARLQLNDINKRYAERIGTRKFPSVLLKATINGELAGVAGLDCHYLDVPNKRLVDIDRALDGKLINIVPVIGNLAVADKYRRSGYGKLLVRSCEVFAQEWGFQDLYLLVASDNIPAQQLYKKCGFNVIYTDENAVAVMSTPNGLRTLQCSKICLGKSFRKQTPSSSSTSSSSFLNSLSDAFKGVFSQK